MVQRSDWFRDPQPLGSRGRPRAHIVLLPTPLCHSCLISDLNIYLGLWFKWCHFQDGMSSSLSLSLRLIRSPTDMSWAPSMRPAWRGSPSALCMGRAAPG